MLVQDAIIFGKNELDNIMESRILLGHAASMSIEKILSHPEQKLDLDQQRLFVDYVKRRKAFEPIAYILGYKEFYGRNFLVDKHVLIPRNDSETLIDAVLANKFNQNNLEILELGTGSGCLSITLLLELQNARATGVDIDPYAIKIAKKNIAKHDLTNRCQIIQSNWFENLERNKKFDLIISNPPYISHSDKDIMSEETKLFEPEIALYATKNGLANYAIIAKNALSFLKQDGKIFVEIGINQSNKIEDIFLENHFNLSKEYKDLSGIVRILEFVC